MRLVWTSWEVSFRAKSGNASEWAGRPQACRFLFARYVFFLKPAFEYLPGVLSRKTVSKFDNSRNLEVCELCCEEIPNLLRSQRCTVVGLHAATSDCPNSASGTPKTAQSATPGMPINACSISAG